MRADLHIHTYYSDGLLSPSEVVCEAKKNGVKILAVTDHDTMLATREVKDICGQNGIKAVNGIEISAYFGKVKLHTLGYGMDSTCADYKAFAEELYEGSIKRAEDIIYKLNKNGVSIKFDDAEKERVCEKSPMHAMYIARAAAKKGYAKTPFLFYSNYLSAGRCAFSLTGRPTPEKALEVIAACGGVSSLAHPGRIELSKEEVFSLIKRLKDARLCGIEAVYSTHTNAETAYYKETANAFNLFVSGGSDTHYLSGSRKLGFPEYEIDKALADKLLI